MGERVPNDSDDDVAISCCIVDVSGEVANGLDTADAIPGHIGRPGLHL